MRCFRIYLYFGMLWQVVQSSHFIPKLSIFPLVRCLAQLQIAELTKQLQTLSFQTSSCHYFLKHIHLAIILIRTNVLHKYCIQNNY